MLTPLYTEEGWGIFAPTTGFCDKSLQKKDLFQINMTLIKIYHKHFLRISNC